MKRHKARREEEEGFRDEGGNGNVLNDWRGSLFCISSTYLTLEVSSAQ